jgi:hypothetical protein
MDGNETPAPEKKMSLAARTLLVPGILVLVGLVFWLTFVIVLAGGPLSK